jgi:hypothetical protein
MANGLDETGWNVAAQLNWLWVAVSEQVTFCDILPGRGFDEAASILGADYEGWLTHDGWQVYYKFLKAGHQSCLNHLLDRAKKLIESASSTRAARFPLRVQEVLEQALALARRYKNKEISLHGLLTATGRLEVKLDRVLHNPGRDPANRRFRNHLDHERPYLFTFLYCPGLDATNNISERAIRALISARKNWGGNRTPRGARAQTVSANCTWFKRAFGMGGDPSSLSSAPWSAFPGVQDVLYRRRRRVETWRAGRRKFHCPTGMDGLDCTFVPRLAGLSAATARSQLASGVGCLS